jgi:protein SCO1/2
MRRRSLETFERALSPASPKSLVSLKSFALSAAALACLCFGFDTAAAQQPSTATAVAPATARTARTEETAAQKYFTDVVLLNQDGEKMRLYSDLLKDKVVVIDFFFSTCQGSCLPLNRNLQKLQAALGDHIGKDVHFVSVSVDPTTDTPARLKEYAKKLEARRGWYFLTGDKANVDFALRKLGGYVDDKQDHTNVFIIGNERTGLWKKAFGLAKSDDLLKVVESVLNDSPAGGR